MANSAKDEESELDIHPVAYVTYYSVLFFAYWFGSHRFDRDGDGDFDPEDVEAYLCDKGYCHRNFNRSRRKTAPRISASDKPSKQSPPLPPPPTTPSEFPGGGDAADFMEAEVTGRAEEDIMMDYYKQMPPWFVIVESVAVLGLWIGMSIADTYSATNDSSSDASFFEKMAGLDSFFPGETVLQWYGSKCEDYSSHLWRWLSYQFTHVGVVHVMMNVILLVLLGVPLEGVHGPFRMFLMFNLGVIGGALVYYINDAHSAVVGCSGGCYALIGIHIADLLINWSQKKFRIPTLVFILFLIGVDLLSYGTSSSTTSVSHSAHVGGALAGILAGLLICRNLEKKVFEYVLIASVAILGLVFVALCVIWIFVSEARGSEGPLNVWESWSGGSGWCWYSAVYDRRIDDSKWLCVRCSTDDCVAGIYRKFDLVRRPALSYCEDNGWYSTS